MVRASAVEQRKNHHREYQKTLMNPTITRILVRALALVTIKSHAVEFTVAPTGDDANPGTARKPLATLQRAQAVIREERAKLPPAGAAAQARIILHAGTYRLTETLALAPQDSNLVIEAAPGERVVTGWQPVKNGIVKADLSEKFGSAELLPDEPAHLLRKTKQPLIRRLRVAADEWVVLVVNPWQAADASSTVNVALGGRHTELFHVVGTNLQRLSVEN